MQQIKNGDFVTYSHLNMFNKKTKSAYAGISGVVSHLDASNSFVINGDGSILVVPLTARKGVWLTVEDNKEIFIPRIKPVEDNKEIFIPRIKPVEDTFLYKIKKLFSFLHV